MAGSRTLTVGVIGVGVVGGALARWFKENTNHILKLYDPGKGFTDDMSCCDATFIAVPVPTNLDGSQNIDILNDAIVRASGVTFIRSTVIPGTNDLFGTYSCPEFLTERTAYEDTCKMPILCGYPNPELMEQLFPNKQIVSMSNKECEMAKYAHNAFGAVKVNFFNIIHDICTKSGCNYKNVLDGVLMSGYINKTHTNVPGPDGQFGFGGACFPKDLRAFNYVYPYLTFATTLSENQEFRGKWL